jgi:uncharacterized protein YciU (UPF0263 family)
MANVYKATESIPAEVREQTTTVFLAGTIDMGNSDDWQSKIELMLDETYTLINPRRVDWDSSWHQDSEQFNEQVHWELDNLDAADVIIMNFLSDSKSPISLLELGLYASSRKMMVCCPKEFYRWGNVRIVCEREDIPLFTTIEELIDDLKK